MKNIDGLLINDIIHDFKQIAVGIETNQGIFVVKPFHKAIIYMGFNGPSNIGLGYPMLESGWIELNIRVHAL
jgi:hypothetical protein